MFFALILTAILTRTLNLLGFCKFVDGDVDVHTLSMTYKDTKGDGKVNMLQNCHNSGGLTLNLNGRLIWRSLWSG